MHEFQNYYLEAQQKLDMDRNMVYQAWSIQKIAGLQYMMYEFLTVMEVLRSKVDVSDEDIDELVNGLRGLDTDKLMDAIL